MVRLRHWLGWCRPGHCPLDEWVPPGNPVRSWLADLGYGIDRCDCGGKHCQGWKVTR